MNTSRHIAPKAAPKIMVKRLAHGMAFPLPAYETPLSAGMDLRAALDSALILAPLMRLAIPTGIAIALPVGYEAQIRPRSGLALKYGLTVANAPGTIDADYRGEIKALMINLSSDPFEVTPGMRIAQMVIAPVVQLAFELCETLDDSKRGEKGFGSTGLL